MHLAIFSFELAQFLLQCLYLLEVLLLNFGRELYFALLLLEAIKLTRHLDNALLQRIVLLFRLLDFARLLSAAGRRATW